MWATACGEGGGASRGGCATRGWRGREGGGGAWRRWRGGAMAARRYRVRASGDRLERPTAPSNSRARPPKWAAAATASGGRPAGGRATGVGGAVGGDGDGSRGGDQGPAPRIGPCSPMKRRSAAAPTAPQDGGESARGRQACSARGGERRKRGSELCAARRGDGGERGEREGERSGAPPTAPWNAARVPNNVLRGGGGGG